MDKVFHCQ